jgi:aspartate/methionine/tyrosine aminotransferase
VPDCPVDSRTLAEICATQAGVVVTPGIAFGQDAPVYLRASFGVPEDEAVRGFESLVRLLGQFKSPARAAFDGLSNSTALRPLRSLR